MELHQRSIWEDLMKGKEPLGLEECPFCNPTKDEEKLLVHETRYWQIRHNKYPYNGLKNHLMTVPKRHVEVTQDLTEEEFADLKNIEVFMHKYYSGENFFSFIRETNSGKSIKHIHYHFLPGVIYARAVEKMLDEQNIY
ncbi:MAG: HIT domain-containing protein [Candidatus Gracilibacteria bacterium]|nr:HIT domain-containing protein [Candidatus Gracilibacteria bacterium]